MNYKYFKDGKVDMIEIDSGDPNNKVCRPATPEDEAKYPKAGADKSKPEKLSKDDQKVVEEEEAAEAAHQKKTRY